MHWLPLPEPQSNLIPAFHDGASARAWLAKQPQAQPMQMLALVSQQIEAIECAPLAPTQVVELLDLLRTATVPAQSAIESRYVRKALPMLDEDQRAFEVAQYLWLHLGIAYLRLSAQFALPEEKLLPLHRAVCAFRTAQYCHFQAAQECPPLIDQLLFAVLDLAQTHDLLRQPLSDPDFPQFGESNISGHLAWAFLLRLLDPYHLSAAQLTVANRAISRWRELTAFQANPDDDPKAHSVDLAPLFDGALPEGMPRWLNVAKVARKVEQRIAALQAGESPEALRLGRELSPTACIRLLRDIDASLEVHAQTPATEIGEIELAFGVDLAYATFTGEMPTSSALETGSATLAHQRMAMFGFDRVSSLPTAVKKLNVPSENWVLVDGRALRPVDREGARRQSPCLIAANVEDRPRLGIMVGLQSIPGNALAARLAWYDEQIEVGRLARQLPQERHLPVVPAFLLHDGATCSLLVPSSAAIRLDSGLSLEGTSIGHVRPTEVLERGIDFVRYAVDKQ